ncbi:MAG: hypothetical protein QOK42_2124 [Frankiaceae bacterium]|jgi:hypothetical protein|nr:hypothetical protein [Frankiaceae bacterium]
MTNEAILERVRKLLAKAEHPSTPAAESEAFSEKAAALIARYAIDDALLSERGAQTGAPVVRTMRVEAPYALPKSVLLSQVASAHRVRVVIGPGVGEASRTCSLVGFPVDLEMTELLFTSLLLQATSAMLADTCGQRVRSFRRSFLLGFASRIGTRLRQLSAQAVAQSEPSQGRSAELVLAGRERRVAAALAEQFPHLRPLRQEISNGRGLNEGRAAASRADLGAAQRRFAPSRDEIGA